MGSLEGEGRPDERPVHLVEVPTFFMMKSEVTVGMYRMCVDAGACSEPDCGSMEECDYGTYNYSSGIDQQAVNYLSWHDLMKFAAWVGARLPTESEWEFAARSRGLSSVYPWGDEAPGCEHVNASLGMFCDDRGTAEVCAHPTGNTAQGLCDMAGNVAEWVQDEAYFEATSYISYNGAPSDGRGRCPGRCPENADDRAYDETSINHRIIRGGGWRATVSEYLSARGRSFNPPSMSFDEYGGRLARTPDPPSPIEPSCGNGVIEADEACDDGDQIDDNMCSNLCTLVNALTDAPCQQSDGGCPDLDWVEIRGGDYIMGSEGMMWPANEQPQRQVNIPTYLMMRTEVTVGMWRQCVEAGACRVPVCDELMWGWNPINTYEGDDLTLPVNCISWFQLMEFAAWVGARLPTEAEWEFAARSRGLDRDYPWDAESTSCDQVNIRSLSHLE